MMTTAKEVAAGSEDMRKAFREELADILIAISIIAKHIAIKLICFEKPTEEE